MEKYLEVIIDKWLREGLPIDRFPFKIFNCDDKYEFFAKYLDICFLYVLSKDKQEIMDIVQQLNLEEKDILMVSIKYSV